MAYLEEIEPGLPSQDYLDDATAIMGWVKPELNPVKRTIEFLDDAEYLFGYPHEEAIKLAEIVFND